MSADRAAASIAALDPESRALLELSMLRGLSDGELAGMLGSDADRMRRRREDVLSSLGVQSEAERADLTAALRGEQSPSERSLPDADPQPDGPVGDEPSPRRGPRRVVWALVGGLTVAVLVAVALALGTNAGSPKPGGGAPRATPEPEAPPVGAPPVALTPLGDGPGKATMQIVVGPGAAPKLRLAMRGLPRVASGGYVVWLYNSISEARELTGSRAGTFSASPPLPAEADRYRFIDISREPADGNRNHSGASVLRVPIERIPRTSR